MPPSMHGLFSSNRQTARSTPAATAGARARILAELPSRPAPVLQRERGSPQSRPSSLAASTDAFFAPGAYPPRPRSDAASSVWTAETVAGEDTEADEFEEEAFLSRVEVLFAAGFVLPFFWVLGALYPLLPHRTRARVPAPDDAESDWAHEELLARFKRHERKWAVRCLLALLCMAVVVLAVALGIVVSAERDEQGAL